LKKVTREADGIRTTALAAAVAIACGAGPGKAFAQEGARALEEIVVTAERRTNAEATTAISVEVLSDSFIAENQIKDIIDLQNAVPALQFFQNGSYVQANIRGVGNPSRGGPSEQVGVPVFFDGATQGEEMGIASGFFDVQGIEVLRGPQATFVGQAAAGGAILINSARPNFDGLNGFIETTVGTYGQRKIMGALNLPISETFAARAAYMSEVRGSYFDNVAGATTPGGSSQWNPGDQQDQNFRMSALWEPSKKVSVWAKLEQSELHSYGPTQQPNENYYIGYWDNDGNPLTPPVPVTTYAPHAATPDPALSVSDGNGGFLPGARPGPGSTRYDPVSPWALANLYPQERDMNVHRESVEVNYHFDNGMTFRSLSSNIQMDRRQTEGGDSLVYDGYQGWQLGPGMKTWSQEFNLISPEGNRLEWLVGLYENKRHTELHFNNPFAGGPYAGISGPVLNCGWQYNSSWKPCSTSLVPGLSRFHWSSLDDVEHKAIFGQLGFHFTDKWALNLELRQNQDHNVQYRSSYTGATTGPTATNTVVCSGNVEGQLYYCPAPGQPDFTPGSPYATQGPLTADDNLPTYKVGVNWEPADGHFLYAFVARGYKAAQSVAAGVKPIVEEVVDDIEIGWKGTLRQGLYAEVGLYSMKYKDMQLNTFSRTAIESRAATSNIGDSTIQGAEASIRAVFGNFGINANVAYTDSKLGEITTLDTRALIGLPNSGGAYPGDINAGCVAGAATVGACFDYSSLILTFNGSENPFSPKLTYLVSFDYEIPLSGGGSITPALSLTHADSTYTNVLQSSLDSYYRTEDRDVLNFSVSYKRDKWDLQLFANNVTNKAYIEGHSNSAAAVFFGDPRVVGLRARMTF